MAKVCTIPINTAIEDDLFANAAIDKLKVTGLKIKKQETAR